MVYNITGGDTHGQHLAKNFERTTFSGHFFWFRYNLSLLELKFGHFYEQKMSCPYVRFPCTYLEAWYLK